MGLNQTPVAGFNVKHMFKKCCWDKKAKWKQQEAVEWRMYLCYTDGISAAEMYIMLNLSRQNDF